ncbi:MAG: MBL fold metallo-hydrolase [Eubacteriales bacterium]|nr:MBL fold metallo-hydrolase [Eubacteriales bacterium]
MKIKWYGTASVSIETEDNKILFDPFIPLPGSGIPVNKNDFQGFSHIFLTHGHMDHLTSIPKLVKNTGTHVWCTKTPAKTLSKRGVNCDRIRVLQPGNKIFVGDMEIQVFQGKHIHFDKQIVKKTLLSSRMLEYAYNIPWVVYQNQTCKENGETVSYLIKAEGKTVFILGSLGLDDNTIYPTGVDLLILPFQGSSDLITPSMEVIKRIQPERIMLDHFDNTFPPISNQISLIELKKWMTIDHPGIKVVKPKYKKTVHLL